MSSPFEMQLFSRSRQAGGKRPPCGRDPDERRRRAEAERVVDRADDRDPVLRLPRPLGVEDRDDLVGP